MARLRWQVGLAIAFPEHLPRRNGLVITGTSGGVITPFLNYAANSGPFPNVNQTVTTNNTQISFMVTNNAATINNWDSWVLTLSLSSTTFQSHLVSIVTDYNH